MRAYDAVDDEKMWEERKLEQMQRNLQELRKENESLKKENNRLNAFIVDRKYSSFQYETQEGFYSGVDR